MVDRERQAIAFHLYLWYLSVYSLLLTFAILLHRRIIGKQMPGDFYKVSVKLFGIKGGSVRARRHP